MEDQAKYLNQPTTRGMTADQWHDWYVMTSQRSGQILSVLASEKMRQRAAKLVDNVMDATDAVMACVNESVEIFNEAAAEILDAAYGEKVPTVSARGLNAGYDAVMAEVKNALTNPDYQTRHLVGALRKQGLKDEETGRLFGGED